MVFSIAVVCVIQLFYRNGEDVIVKDGVALPYLVARGMSVQISDLYVKLSFKVVSRKNMKATERCFSKVIQALGSGTEFSKTPYINLKKNDCITLRFLNTPFPFCSTFK